MEYKNVEGNKKRLSLGFKGHTERPTPRPDAELKTGEAKGEMEG